MSKSDNSADEHIVQLYESREKIYPRETKGPFQQIRKYGLIVLLIIYFILPWINWNDRQAILFDMVHRRFYIFDIVIWPQDLIILTLILLGLALVLFFVTSIAGRVWCGYACPQTIWTESFIWIERFIEGGRQKQIKLDQMPWNKEKIVKKLTKHLIWLLFSLLTGLTFVGYFTPIKSLSIDFFTLSAGFSATIFTLIYTFATYLNAGWLREQICKSMCPYARFQGAMYDENTLLVVYDSKRGEPRRKAKKGENQDGHCIDCSMCVQVCPVGIDIRDGTQYQCIGCALCIDACNDVMMKIDAPKNLIRYASQNEIDGKKERFIRPKTVGYAMVLVIVISVLTYNILNISPIGLNVNRDRNVLARSLYGGDVENIYSINVLNKTLEPASYQITVDGITGLRLKKDEIINVEAGKVYDEIIQLVANKKEIKEDNTEISITIENIKTKEKTTTKTRFLNANRR